MTKSKPEPTWHSLIQVTMLHSESLKLFGGSTGIRDQGLLESALERPRNRWQSEEEVSVFHLAASYAFGIARNLPFVDGNKRTALLAIRAFLFTNGYSFSPEEIETVTTIERLAEGSVDEELLARWIESHSKRRN